MVKNKNNSVQRYVSIGNDSIAPGANLGWAEVYYALHDEVDTLATSDGRRAQAKEITINLYQKSNDGSFVIQPVFVQTNGNFVDTVNLSNTTVHELLDAAIDDEFGYHMIGKPIQSVLGPHNNVAVSAYQVIRRTFKVPQNILQILNKETQTERLQEIYFGVVGRCDTNSNIESCVSIAIDYILRSKNIIQR